MARSIASPLLATLLTVALALPAAAQSGKPPANSGKGSTARGSSMPPPDPPPSEEDRLRTSDQVKRSSVEGAVTTPLRDLNVMRVELPPILLQALDDPYARPPRNARCPTLIALIRPLNDVLGPDIDTIQEDEEGLTTRGKSTALGVAGDLAGGAIPFRGIVRRLSGAESHDRLVAAAVIAGHTRRAYLKGLGEARGCGPPATPSHARTAMLQAAAKAEIAPPQPSKGGLTPRYPTR
ncbi:MAG: hypothetical protein U1C74_11490 [Phenylobacterium sp.]|nr:hypothetical protein [Phenylobacterium sp.]